MVLVGLGETNKTSRFFPTAILGPLFVKSRNETKRRGNREEKIRNALDDEQREDVENENDHHLSMDWFKGFLFPGNHGFSHEIWGVPVNFPLNQSIEPRCAIEGRYE